MYMNTVYPMYPEFRHISDGMSMFRNREGCKYLKRVYILYTCTLTYYAPSGKVSHDFLVIIPLLINNIIIHNKEKQ